MTGLPPPGLCDACVHRRIVSNRRGSHFLLCGLSRTDPRFPRYPRLPVLVCDGFAPGIPDERSAPGGARERRM